jgi:hypothetical protein
LLSPKGTAALTFYKLFTSADPKEKLTVAFATAHPLLVSAAGKERRGYFFPWRSNPYGFC